MLHHEGTKSTKSTKAFALEILDCTVKMDLVIEHTVIVEVKAVEKLIPVHRAQLLTYLRLQNLWLGLLINFHVEVLRDGLRRVLNG
jgi:GxxExxY protein